MFDEDDDVRCPAGEDDAIAPEEGNSAAGPVATAGRMYGEASHTVPIISCKHRITIGGMLISVGFAASIVGRTGGEM